MDASPGRGIAPGGRCEGRYPPLPAPAAIGCDMADMGRPIMAALVGIGVGERGDIPIWSESKKKCLCLLPRP